MESKDPLELAQLIVRGSYINFNYNQAYGNTSSIYRFSNENISSYYHHLKNKEKVLTVIGSGGQILNSILAGTRDFDCFDISIFPEYYLYLQIASVIALSKEEYMEYYFSEDREVLFSDNIYYKISTKLKDKYEEFWDTLYMYDDGIDIYNSRLFKYDLCLKKNIIKNNPIVADITKVNFSKSYDLINLSNILTYYKNLPEQIKFLNSNFHLKPEGEIISYFFQMDEKTQKNVSKLLNPDSYIEDLKPSKLLVYKR